MFWAQMSKLIHKTEIRQKVQPLYIVYYTTRMQSMRFDASYTLLTLHLEKGN